MKLDIFNISEFVEANHCPEVTNPIFFNFDTTPTADGLFSYELFGITDEERKNIFGYINLNGNYLHPLVYTLLTKRFGSIKDILNGSKYAVVANKKIKIVDENTPNAETGLDFIYDHFEEIDWINELEEDEIESLDKKTRLKFLNSLSKDEFFVNKWLVLPPFYRAESSTNKSMGDSINKLYKELIQKTRAMKTGFSMALFGAETKYRIQNLLRDIYFAAMAPASGKNLILDKSGRTELKGSGKNSMIRKHLLGKTVDWTASNVITSVQNNQAENLDEKPVPFGYSAFPLATLLSLFQPFYVSYAEQFLQERLVEFEADNGHLIKKIDTAQFTADTIQKMIKQFIKAPNERFEPIPFTFINKEGKEQNKYLGIYEFKTQNDINKNNYTLRKFTITDLFFLISKEVLTDKHVYVTRYPVANFQNIFPTKIKVLTTSKTRKVFISLDPKAITPVYFTDYPTINNKDLVTNEIDSEFYDVMLPGNVYLDSLGRRL